ncbi:hypothetical protein C8J57DRAFT_1499444 [Mycena rebaudengoi]|nr:hypothetical protein C8J57DRAFT_1499444 [Mycena rebaudengoi]
MSPGKDFNCVTLLAACSQTVQQLNMDLIAPAPRFLHFSALRTLTIKVSLWRTRNIPADLLITLQQLPLATPRLEDIALAFAPESERARRNSPWVAGPQWTLDPKLEMPLLRAVRCSIAVRHRTRYQ